MRVGGSHLAQFSISASAENCVRSTYAQLFPGAVQRVQLSQRKHTARSPFTYDTRMSKLQSLVTLQCTGYQAVASVLEFPRVRMSSISCISSRGAVVQAAAQWLVECENLSKEEAAWNVAVEAAADEEVLRMAELKAEKHRQFARYHWLPSSHRRHIPNVVNMRRFLSLECLCSFPLAQRATRTPSALKCLVYTAIVWPFVLPSESSSPPSPFLATPQIVALGLCYLRVTLYGTDPASVTSNGRYQLQTVPEAAIMGDGWRTKTGLDTWQPVKSVKPQVKH